MNQNSAQNSAMTWIESLVQTRLGCPKDKLNWDVSASYMTLHHLEKNLRFEFPKELIEQCAEAESAKSLSLKSRLEIVFRDIKVREYENARIGFGVDFSFGIQED